jgi:hypothetical protein
MQTVQVLIIGLFIYGLSNIGISAKSSEDPFAKNKFSFLNLSSTAKIDSTLHLLLHFMLKKSLSVLNLSLSDNDFCMDLLMILSNIGISAKSSEDPFAFHYTPLDESHTKDTELDKDTIFIPIPPSDKHSDSDSDSFPLNFKLVRYFPIQKNKFSFLNLSSTAKIDSTLHLLLHFMLKKSLPQCNLIPLKATLLFLIFFLKTLL